jgi:hypothetical protein
MLIKITSFVRRLNSRLKFEKPISRNKVYGMIRAGEIKGELLGSEFYIEDSEIDKLETKFKK